MRALAQNRLKQKRQHSGAMVFGPTRASIKNDDSQSRVLNCFWCCRKMTGGVNQKTARSEKEATLKYGMGLGIASVDPDMAYGEPSQGQ
jgi:hypothetical protein